MYMYPPRQAYRKLDLVTDEVAAGIRDSCVSRERLNLYVHLPFCKQICAFCNLYTTTVRAESVHQRYVDALSRQMDALAELVPPNHTIPTIYFGGGTPTVLPIQMLGRVLQRLEDIWGNIDPGAEIAIEVDPQTVDRVSLDQLRSAGFNRVNLGVQSRSPQEILAIGRRYTPDDQAARVREAMAAGFNNVCVDLIFGLPAQTVATWERSVRECIELHPHTICCYPLTHRPFTGFDRRGAERSHVTYDMWTIANELLVGAGYSRQSQVRWARDGGGYRQKELHWGLENVLGIGAGARSYLWDLDLRNGYSIVDRNAALTDYMEAMETGRTLPPEGYVMDDEERARKAVVLGLLHLDLDKYEKLLGERLDDRFANEFAQLEALGFVERTTSTVRISEPAVPFRDVIVQLFFSDRVRTALAEFSYDQ
jgi:oxygen-independent coproporphyrinogen-3 oxidase